MTNIHVSLQGPIQVLDLVAYDGYKFVGVIVTILASLLNFGTTVYSLVFLYTFLSTSFFLVRPLSLFLWDLLLTACSSAPSVRSSCQMRPRPPLQ